MLYMLLCISIPSHCNEWQYQDHVINLFLQFKKSQKRNESIKYQTEKGHTKNAIVYYKLAVK